MVSIQVGDGVPADSVGYALDHLRTLCTAYPLDSLRVRMRRTGHPSMPTYVLAQADAVMAGRLLRARAVGPSPQAAVDVARARLGVLLGAAECWDRADIGAGTSSHAV